MATKKTTKSKSKKVQKQLHEQLVLNKYFLSLFDMYIIGIEKKPAKTSDISGSKNKNSKQIK